MRATDAGPGGERSPVTQLFGRQILEKPRAQQDRLIDEALAYWRLQGFPYPTLTTEELAREFRGLSLVSPKSLIHAGQVRPATVGLRLANSFQPGLWAVPSGRHAKTPIDHFNNDDTLRRLLSRALRFWPDRRCWNAQCIRSTLRIYGGGRVSNFRPAAARAIISQFSKDGAAVLDFSAGFGGRLLGCMTLNRQYIGIEPAAAQMHGLRKMTSTLKKHTACSTHLIKGCAEEVIPNLSRQSVDLIFSSPPYFKAERYSTESTQSFNRYPTYGAWKEHFLRPVLQGSHRALRNSGLLVVNVADTCRHPVATDLIGIASPLYRVRHVLKLLMHARPEQRSTSCGKSFRWEPVFVLQKR